MYVVVEFDPGMGQHHVLFPRYSMAQIHQTLDAAEQHLRGYVEATYAENRDLGFENVRIYRLEAV